MCQDAARAAGTEHLIAIVHPQNVPSQRVARKIGLRLERSVPHDGGEILVYGTDLT